MSPFAHVDFRAIELAESQHGVIARRQLLTLGLSHDAVKRWVASGRLLRLHRGVYALGHRALKFEGAWMAAVLACGDGAALSHRSGGRLLGLRPWSGRIEVTVPGQGGCRGTHDLLVHRSTDLPDDEITVVDGIPVTTVPRTLLDLAALVPAHHLRRAVERAEELELFDLRSLNEVLERHPGRPGSRPLRDLLADIRVHDLPTTRSDVEAAMLQLCLDHDLPRPHVNRHADGLEVDFRWPAQLLRVEVDSWAHHHTRSAFSRDRARARQALLAGERVAQFTATEVLRSPQIVAHQLGELLGVRQRAASARKRTPITQARTK